MLRKRVKKYANVNNSLTKRRKNKPMEWVGSIDTDDGVVSRDNSTYGEGFQPNYSADNIMDFLGIK